MVWKTYFKKKENGVQLLPLWFIPCKTENNIVCCKYTVVRQMVKLHCCYSTEVKDVALSLFFFTFIYYEKSKMFPKFSASLSWLWMRDIWSPRSAKHHHCAHLQANSYSYRRIFNIEIRSVDLWQCFSWTDIRLIVGWRPSILQNKMRWYVYKCTRPDFCAEMTLSHKNGFRILFSYLWHFGEQFSMLVSSDTIKLKY